ncbi:hypothetical protein DFQ13_12342 [Actinokineospora spheciospongiae]|nr:hypothetical protein DFQ13_12342 [Actinokineospora spheciospongiae]
MSGSRTLLRLWDTMPAPRVPDPPLYRVRCPQARCESMCFGPTPQAAGDSMANHLAQVHELSRVRGVLT